MSDRRRALGRGLGALISNSGSNSGRSDNPEAGSVPLSPSSDASAPAPEGVTWVPVDQVDPNPSQPRRVFDPSKLETLAASILQHGVLQPVVVQSVGDRYELVVGERRWRA